MMKNKSLWPTREELIINAKEGIVEHTKSYDFFVRANMLQHAKIEQEHINNIQNWLDKFESYNRKDIATFLREHTHIDYCEAVIFKDGTLEYVKPSHTETMIRATGLSREKIYSLMNVADSPIHWLVAHTEAICVWSEGYMSPKLITKEQEIALRKLIEANLVKNNKFN